MIHRSPRGSVDSLYFYIVMPFISIFNDSHAKNTCNLHAKVL
mgnify:CR=1 FL=1